MNFFLDVGLDTKATSATRAFGTPDVCTAHARSPGSAIVGRAGEDSSVTKVTITSHSNQHHNAITDNKITPFHSNLSANITSQLQLQYFSQPFYDYKICRSSSLLEKMAISIENTAQRRLISPCLQFHLVLLYTIAVKLAGCIVAFW